MKSKGQQNISLRTSRLGSKPSLYIKYPKRRISTIDSLCKALCVTPAELTKHIENSQTQYTLHKVKEKPDGTLRYIYNLKSPLKQLHKKINECFLKKCLYPTYIKGSIKGSDYIASALIHCGKPTVIKLDITNFFPNITLERVESIWSEFFNFSKEVSHTLARLCCYKGALVQGSPVSSYLANIFFWKIEPRIVSQFESEGFCYGRYVDDIVVSASRKVSKKEKSEAVQRIKSMIKQEGMLAKNRKTKVMGSAHPQMVHGLTVNGRSPSMPKSERKKLRAAVHRLNTKHHESSLSFEDRRELMKLKGKLYNLRRTNKSIAERLLKELPKEY